VLKLRYLLPGLIITLLLGCSQDTNVLRVGSNTWPGYEPFYVARELGLLNTQTIRLVELPDATSVMDGMRQGLLEAAALTLDETLLLASEGMPLTIVMICDESSGADAVVAQPGVASLADLKQKRIGVETSAVGALMLEGLLHKARLDKADIEVIPMTILQHQQAFENNQVDALVTFEPVLGNLLKNGAVKLFDSTDIPGQIIDVLVVRNNYLSSHEDAIQSLVGGFHLAWQQLQGNDPAAHKAAALRLQVEPLTQAWDGMEIPGITQNIEYLQGQPAALTVSAARLRNLLQSHGLLANSATSRQLPAVSARFMEKISL